MKSILQSRFFLWALLAVPSLPMIAALAGGTVSGDGRSASEFLLHPTGEFAARFMIIAMIISPLRLIFPKSRFWHWMGRRRRAFGVAAFGYAALHTALYLVDMGTLRSVLGDFRSLGIWTGWLAFVVFVPLAVTSNDASVRLLGRSWKPLQRTVYAAAVATLLHWMFVHNNFGPALVHFLPLAGLEVYRLHRIYGKGARAGHVNTPQEREFT
ncbi:ferric reductase-like transmembrane domain-containing protein [Roseibium sp. AS2]|uniref:sulfite oxidase heme-binding subunit YedZ n=1 Tax=Roseibium sp. AS2 TaxID=3135781 RepID=UPI00316B373E